MKQDDGGFGVSNFVPHSVVADANPKLVVVALQFDAARWSWIVRENHEASQDSSMNAFGQALKLFLDRLRDDYPIAHDVCFARDAR